MLYLNAIHHDAASVARVPLSELRPPHQLREGQRRMLEKRYRLAATPVHPGSHQAMLASAMRGLLDGRDGLRAQDGLLIYAKTQTHNTFFDRDWLDALLIEQGLSRWEAATLSLNHCASALSALHLLSQPGMNRDRPVILLTGEKAFHPEISRFTVGVQGELPVAALLNAGPAAWGIAATSVKHLGRFYQNPDRMSRQEKAALNDGLLDALCAFMTESLAAAQVAPEEIDDFIPCNFNLPLLDEMADRLRASDRLYRDNVPRVGHLYCSDALFNFCSLLNSPPPHAEKVFCFAIGMGVTFSSALIQRISL